MKSKCVKLRQDSFDCRAFLSCFLQSRFDDVAYLHRDRISVYLSLIQVEMFIWYLGLINENLVDCPSILMFLSFADLDPWFSPVHPQKSWAEGPGPLIIKCYREPLDTYMCHHCVKWRIYVIMIVIIASCACWECSSKYYPGMKARGSCWC